MGVKGFNTWFGKTFPQAYVPVKRQVDHLYLDMASFLHEELRKGAASLLQQTFMIDCPSAGHCDGQTLQPPSTSDRWDSHCWCR